MSTQSIHLNIKYSCTQTRRPRVRTCHHMVHGTVSTQYSWTSYWTTLSVKHWDRDQYQCRCWSGRSNSCDLKQSVSQTARACRVTSISVFDRPGERERKRGCGSGGSAGAGLGSLTISQGVPCQRSEATGSAAWPGQAVSTMIRRTRAYPSRSSGCDVVDEDDSNYDGD